MQSTLSCTLKNTKIVIFRLYGILKLLLTIEDMKRHIEHSLQKNKVILSEILTLYIFRYRSTGV